MARCPGEEGVSEIIGVMLLVGVTVLAVAVVAAILLSGPHPDEIPRATIVAGNESGCLALVHEGGDPLGAGEYRVYIDAGSGLADATDAFSKPAGGVWSIGGTLVYNGAGTPERVVVTAVSGGGETILAEPDFRGGAAGFSPDPAEPGVIDIPAPTPERIVISPGIGDNIEIGNTGNEKDFDFAAKIERDDIVRVDLIVYNYDELRNTPDQKITSVHAYEMTKNTVLDYYYNRTLQITGAIGKANDQLSITIIAYNTTGVTASQTVLSTLQG